MNTNLSQFILKTNILTHIFSSYRAIVVALRNTSHHPSKMRLLIYIVTLLVLSGCALTQSADERCLDHAQTLMDRSPEEAWQYLNDIDVTAFNDSATMARWALLYGEAMVANRYTAPTDTIINIAVDYYGSKNIVEHYQRACQLKEKLAEMASTNELASALYRQKEREFMLYKERVRWHNTLFIGITALLITIGIIIWQRQRIKIKNIQTEALMAEASMLKNGALSSQNECEVLTGKLTETLSRQFSTLDELCQTYYESQGTKSERKAIVNKVISQIESIRTDAGLFLEMEHAVNLCRNNLLTTLKNEMPEIKDEEYRLFTYLSCNLSNRTIALLIGESVDVVYKRKSRLKAKLQSCSAELTSVF